MATRSVDGQAERVSAMMEMQTQAQAQGLGAQRKRQIGVLATARGQQADATTGLASAARLAQSDRLQSAARKQQLRDARTGAAMQMGGAMLATGLDNLQQGAGFFGGKGLNNDKTAVDRMKDSGARFGQAIKDMYG